MARKIVVLEREKLPSGELRYRYALWAAVQAARQPFYANAGATSQVRGEASLGDGGITAAELVDLRAGKFVERVDEGTWPAAATNAQIQAALIDAYTNYQAEVDGFNPSRLFGTSWDGTTWTVKQTA